MACQVHEGRQKIMVCVPCKSCVCELCIEDSHNGHPLKSFKTAAKNVISDLLKLTESPSFATLDKHLEGISAIRQREGEQAVKTKQELLDRRDQLKQVLDEVTETAVVTLDQHNEKLFKELGEATDNARGQSQKVRDFKNKVNRLKSTDNHLQVVEEGRQIESPEIIPLEFPEVSRLTFQFDTPVDAVNVEMLFGELVQQDLYALTTFHPDGTFSTPVLGHYNPNPSPASSICTLDLFGEGPEEAISDQTQPTGTTDVSTSLKVLQNVQSLKCDVKLKYERSFKMPAVIRAMQPTVEGRCWIRFKRVGKTISLVSTTGDIIQDVLCTFQVRGIVWLPTTNQVLLACPFKKCVKQLLMKHGKYIVANSKCINTDPMAPLYMCVTSHGDILVTMTDKTSMSVEPNSTSVLAKYSSKGKELARAHRDGHGRDLFFAPFDVKTSNTGTVAVINVMKKNPDASHLVVLDHEFNLTHRYISQGQTVPAEDQISEFPENFYITDVLFNHQSLLLVSEMYSRTVQLLDTKCNLLKVLITGLQDIPYSLALHADGDLWVGLNDTTVQVYKHICDFKSD